ncbi:MAG: endo-1,4-beta-xylanase [Bacillota bacterium]|nr:endo-1,4-beta-xylanase [Bacillota bacterium]
MDKDTVMSNAVKQFDSYDYYIDKKIKNDIEEYRKGQFAISFTDENGNPLKDVKVKIRQTSHEFKFGCTTFYLDQFEEKEKNKLYRQKFADIFNCGVVPLYWDTLEPSEGHPRFESDCAKISRRPPVDDAVKFCTDNNMSVKGHCLVYNSFQPDWISNDNRILKMQIERRVKAISDRYETAFECVDVINEMISIYKNCYKGNSMRNMQLADERDHEKWAFDLCKRYFPNSRLFWNEGGFESFGNAYKGYRSFYYMELQRQLSMGVPIEGIGMQYHLYSPKYVPEGSVNFQNICNPLRIADVLDCYGDFNLPIHISEVSVPSWSNEEFDEQNQADMVKRLYSLWFSSKNVSSVIWWNFADGTAYETENYLFAGLIRNDCSEKPAYKVLNDLINKEWHTELEATVDSRLNFRGFYGNYEIEAVYGDKKTVKSLRLFKENTGFDNRICDFRNIQIKL